MSYTKLSREQNRSCKLTNSEISHMRLLHDQGIGRKEISLQFKVSTTTVRYWTDDDYRKKDNERCADRKNRKLQDIDYRRIENERKKERRKYRLSLGHQDYKKWYHTENVSRAKSWRDNNPDYSKNPSRKISQKRWVENNRGKIRQYGRCYFYAKNLNGFRLFWKRNESQ